MTPIAFEVPIKARATLAERLDAMSTPEPNTGCFLWMGDSVRGGYGRVRVAGTKHLAHRVAFALSGVALDPGHVVMHTCDQPACVNPTHLRLGTHAENMKDRNAKGRQAQGDRHARLKGQDNGQSRLTEAQVVEIRRRYASGETQHALGAEFGVTQNTISRIVRRAAWRHVP